MSSREDLEFLFEAVSGLLHMEACGGAGELRAAKFDKRRHSYRESSATLPIAEEIQRLKKRVADLEEAIRDDRNGRATYYREIDRRLVELERQAHDRETTGLGDHFPDDL